MNVGSGGLHVVLSHKIIGVLVACIIAVPLTGRAHGFAGQRFFPATIATEDPFVADELSLPTVSTFTVPGQNGSVLFFCGCFGI